MNSSMRDFPIAFRLFSMHMKDDVFLERLAELAQEFPNAFNELWFSTISALPPLEIHEKTAMKESLAAEKLRNCGFRISLQIAESIGHLGYGKNSYEAFNWESMVNDNGESVPNISCPRSSGFLEYEEKMVKLYVQALKPDTLWIDDDLRLTNHGVISHGCFCPRCLSEFSAQQGKNWSREELVSKLTDEGSSSVRQAWCDFNQSSLAFMTEKIAKAAVTVHPGVRIAIQCAHHDQAYNGMNFIPALKTIYKASGRKGGIRPGAGTYTDYDPCSAVIKTFWLGGIALESLQSGYADIACSEVENYPHTVTGKTAYGTALEAALGLAFGCNSLSFALRTSQTTSFEADRALWREINMWNPFYKALAGNGKRVRPTGFVYGRSPKHLAQVHGKGWSWTRMVCGPDVDSLLFNGIPMIWDETKFGKYPMVVTEDSASGMTAKDIMEATGNFLMSAGAFRMFLKKGIFTEFGIQYETITKNYFPEIFTDDPLNGSGAGERYSMPTWISENIIFHTSNPKIRILSYMDDFRRNDSVGSFIIPLPNNRKIAVIGPTKYFSRQLSEAKFRQLSLVMDYLFDGKAPVIAETVHSQTLVPLIDDNSSLYGVFVLNSTIEPQTKLSLKLRGIPAEVQKIEYLTPKNGSVMLPLTRDCAGEIQVALPPLDGWSCGFLKI